MNLKNKLLEGRKAFGMSADQQQAIGHLSKGCNFVWQGESDPIKIAVIISWVLLELQNENLTIIIVLCCQIHFVFWCLCHSIDPLQIDVFPETWPERGDVKDLTKHSEPIAVKGPDHELTFKGIKKHQIINIDGDGQPKIDALKELLRRSGKVTTVVFVNQSETIRPLIVAMQYLSDDGWKVFSINKKIAKKARNNKITQQELYRSDLPCLIIALEEWAHLFDLQQIRLVVNYDMTRGYPVHYLRRMGRFREVDAIYFVTGKDWSPLVEIQDEYKVHFEVTFPYGPAGFCLREEQQVAKDFNGEFPRAAQDTRHFALDCARRGWKLCIFLEGVMEVIIQTKSVIFVNTREKVNILLEKVVVCSLLVTFILSPRGMCPGYLTMICLQQ
ncbi:hypothetical protein AQUCO_07400079v1 [Aquilegia coerulea]|uniref:Helicase C-terminal domain-containing protein n=1 Tax=Aquilegia coerulea TaxID=218851 RepID=A0A2G5C9N6_AQUCA|nr:hypothetical protein AQUCO_07400079v1 [Aquilegia coerulea]